MRKLIAISLLFVAMLGFWACDKDEYKVEEWQIASDTGVGKGWSGFQTAYIVKKGHTLSWQSCTETIEGFSFEKGYEYRLRVRIDPVADLMADGSSVRYTLLEIISRTETQTIDPEEYCPKFEVVVASKLGEKEARPFYWIKIPISGNKHWTPLNHRIEGFEYIPGYEYRLQVRVWAEGAPGTYNAQIHYTLLEVLACEQTESTEVPIEDRY